MVIAVSMIRFALATVAPYRHSESHEDIPNITR
jgi:hypothetical protein